MTAVQMNTGSSYSFMKWVILLLTVAIVSVAFISYGDMEMTHHARTAHQEEVWNAESIRTYFDAGGCKPIIDICPQPNREVHHCQVDDETSIGLVIGTTKEVIRVIVTGFGSEPNYWPNQCGGTQ